MYIVYTIINVISINKSINKYEGMNKYINKYKVFPKWSVDLRAVGLPQWVHRIS